MDDQFQELHFVVPIEALLAIRHQHRCRRRRLLRRHYVGTV
jgi:hypothetical protein